MLRNSHHFRRRDERFIRLNLPIPKNLMSRHLLGKHSKRTIRATMACGEQAWRSPQPHTLGRCPRPRTRREAAGGDEKTIPTNCPEVCSACPGVKGLSRHKCERGTSRIYSTVPLTPGQANATAARSVPSRDSFSRPHFAVPRKFSAAKHCETFDTQAPVAPASFLQSARLAQGTKP